MKKIILLVLLLILMTLTVNASSVQKELNGDSVPVTVVFKDHAVGVQNYYKHHWAVISLGGKVLGEYSKEEPFSQTNVFRYNFNANTNYFDLVAVTEEIIINPGITTTHKTFFFKRIIVNEENQEIVLDIENAATIKTNAENVASSVQMVLNNVQTTIYRVNPLSPPLAWQHPNYTPILFEQNKDRMPIRGKSTLAIESDNTFFNDYAISVIYSANTKLRMLTVGTDFYYPFTKLTKTFNSLELKHTTINYSNPFGFSKIQVSPYSKKHAQIKGLGFSSFFSGYNEKGDFYYYDDCEFCNQKIIFQEQPSPNYKTIKTEYLNGVGTVPGYNDTIMPAEINIFKTPLTLALSNNYDYYNINNDFRKDKILRGYLKDSLNDKGNQFIENNNDEFPESQLYITPPDSKRTPIFTPTTPAPENGFGLWLIDCTKPKQSFPETLQEPKFCKKGEYKIEWTLKNVVENKTLTLNLKVNYNGKKFTVVEPKRKPVIPSKRLKA
ncbi:MAG: hypothetical protein ABH821_03625 [archaeon]